MPGPRIASEGAWLLNNCVEVQEGQGRESSVAGSGLTYRLRSPVSSAAAAGPGIAAFPRGELRRAGAEGERSPLPAGWRLRRSPVAISKLSSDAPAAP